MKTTISKKYEIRNSNVELLKICAIFLIIISHTIPANVLDELCYTSLSVGIILLQLFRNFGQIGNIIFICCSAYYLVDSTNFKFSKVLSLVFDTLIISLSSLLISFILGIELTYDIVIKLIFPITFQLNWFIGCYILYYFSHPYLNLILEKIDTKNLIIFSIVLFILYFLIDFLIGDKYYYTNLICFFSVHVFLYLFKKKLNFNDVKMSNLIFINISSFLLFILMLVFVNYLGQNFDFFNKFGLFTCKLNNPFFLIIGISLVFVFNKFEFHSKIINFISSFSVLIYLLHENYILSFYAKPLIFEFFFNLFRNDYLIFAIILLSIFYFLASLIVAIIYHFSVGNFVNYFAKRIFNFTKKQS